jgi:hypothetical protein
MKIIFKRLPFQVYMLIRQRVNYSIQALCLLKKIVTIWINIRKLALEVSLEMYFVEFDRFNNIYYI